MFESFSSVDSSRTTPTEWLLARIAGRERAAAIMGDLEELAATRSRLWFWTAYARTLVTLGWRAPVAFIGGFAGFCLFLSLYPIWEHSSQTKYLDYNSDLNWNSVVFLAAISVTLWFALPYAILRFGHRDRMTQLCWAFFLLTTPVFCLRTSVTLTCTLVTLAVILAALFSPLWRRPMIVLAATVGTSLAALIACDNLVTNVYPQHIHDPYGLNQSAWMVAQIENRLTVAAALLIAAFVCSRLHRWLLQRPLASDRTIA